jgi:hypothetical protein
MGSTVYISSYSSGPNVVHCPKRLVHFGTDNYGRSAPAINNENVRYRKQAFSAIVIDYEMLCIFWDSVQRFTSAASETDN